MASLATHKASQDPSTRTRDVRPSNVPSTREVLKEQAARTGGTVAPVLRGSSTAATKLGQFAKNVGVNDGGRAVAPAPMEVEKARDTVKEVHDGLDEGAGADRDTVTHSHDYSGPGRANQSDEVREYGDIGGRPALSLSNLHGLAVGDDGRILDNDGRAIGKVVEGDPSDLVGQIVNGYGEILDEDGDLIGCVDVLHEEGVASDGGRDGRVWGDDPGVDAPGREEFSPLIAPRGEEYASSKRIRESRESRGEEMKSETHISSPEAAEEQADAGQDDKQLRDISALEGLTCNILGEIITPNGITVGELVDGDAMRICINELYLDDQGQFKDSRGFVIGRARPIPSSQTKVCSDTGIMKELAPKPIPKNEEPGAPSAGSRVLDTLTVDREGVVYDFSGRAVGRLADSDRDQDHDGLAPRPLDADAKTNAYGILDKTDTRELPLPQEDEKPAWFSLGFGIRDTEPEPLPEPESHAKHARLNMQSLTRVVVDDSGYSIDTGHLANEMCAIVQQTVDSVDPLCGQITLDIEEALVKSKNHLAAERLVENLRPLMIMAGDILQDCNNTLRSLDSDGQVASTLSSYGHLYPIPDTMTSECQLANLLKELAQTVVDTITTGRYRLFEMAKEMPYARRKINPLWTLLSNRLFGIISTVGLLRTGIIGLFSSLLKGPWLGRVLRRLLIGIGLDRVLDRLRVERLLTAVMDGEAWVIGALDGVGAGVGDLLKGLLSLFGFHGVLESMRVGMVSEALELER
ncbi:hypothetical protein BDW66DRAFT_166864 [Aspergillus desertorum]